MSARLWRNKIVRGLLALLAVPAVAGAAVALAQEPNSYSPVVITEAFDSIVKRLSGEKAKFAKRHRELLERRYDLSDRPAKDVTMTRGKPIQEGVRVKLPKGVASWDDLSAMTPAQIRDKGLFPEGFMPLPFPKHEEGGMVFPQFLIDSIKEQEGRDLTRFDLDFDIPEHFLPEFPPRYVPHHAAGSG